MNRLKNKIETLIDNSQYSEAVELIRNEFDFSFEAEFLENNYHFQGDKDKRDIYSITLKRGARKYTFKFGQSIANSGFYAQYGRQKYNIPIELLNKSDFELKRYVKMNLQHDFGNITRDTIVKPIAPTLYDILSCLQKYEVGTFEDFCGDFGYDQDSRTALKTYKAVVKEYDKVCSLFSNEELEVLQMIN